MDMSCCRYELRCREFVCLFAVMPTLTCVEFAFVILSVDFESPVSIHLIPRKGRPFLRLHFDRCMRFELQLRL